MSTSSLTSIPASQLPAPSSDTLDIPPPKPAPKRTYGRTRQISPPPITETSSSSSIIPPVRSSPSKLLLDRWSAANQSWRHELSKLDAPSSDKTEEQEEDEEATMRELEKMRKQARLLKGLDKPSTSIQPTERHENYVNRQNLDIPKNRSGNAFSSSSLTSIPTTVPTSPLRSSPPPLPSSPPPSNRKLQAQSSEIAEETMFPVRKSGMSGKQKRIIVSDEEDSDEDDNAPLFAKDTSRSASPIEGEDCSTTERGSSPPPLSINRRNRDDDEDDGENMADYLDELAEKQARAEKQKEAEEVGQHPRSSALDGLDDLFDNDEEEPREKKVGASRGLNKVEKAEMEKDIARAQRERPVVFSRPEPSRLPITAWLAQANVAVKTREPIEHKIPAPGLTFAKSPQTSPSQPTPPDDDIIGFTPSSGTRRHLGTTSTSRISIENRNTPTPAPNRKDKGKGKVVVPGTSEGAQSNDEDEDEEQDFVTFMDKDEIRQQKLAENESKRKKLEEFKQTWVRQQTAKLNLEPSKLSSSDHEQGLEDDESDLEFDDDEVTPKKEVPIVTNIRKGPGAKAILSKTNDQNIISKQKQGFLARAGKLNKTKKLQQQSNNEISETYIDFAGKTFSHSNQKQLNGGSKPTNQKKGREEVISQIDMDNFIKLKHQQQVINLQKTKEEVYGRVKILPQRVEHDVEILVEESLKTQDHNDADAEDGEDEDYNPDEEEEEEDKMVWSGEEAEDGEGSDDEAGNEFVEDNAEDEKENQVRPIPIAIYEDDEEDTTPIIKRRPRASARVAFDSDDEDAVSRIRSSPVQRAPLAEVPAPQPTAKSTGAGDGFEGFDFGGFGDDSGSQGFSQLFGATQAGTQAGGEQDAFAALRAEPAGFFPVNAMLPGVDISKTQVERDNNLIAAEIEEAAMERMQELEKPKKQYINEGGFFTQTKPASLPQPTYNEDTQISESRKQLGGESDYSIFNGYTPAKTQTQTQAQTQIDTPLDRRESAGYGSPTQTQEESFTRLRRRLSIEEEDSIPLSPTQHSLPFQEEQIQPKRTIFDKMMKASNKLSEKEKSKMKSRLVDEQAEESDEDNGWAKIGGNGEDDEDDDEENDGFVEDLVDDQVIGEEEKRRQDELAAEKNREIQAADDLRLEAEARKITEGQFRIKKRGNDFFDDEDSDDERSGRKKKLTKKQRRKRMLDREDGLDKLEGEANVFRQVYVDDLESDEDEVDETPYFDADQFGINQDPLNRSVEDQEEEEVVIAPKRTFREAQEMIRKRAEMNRGKTTDQLVAEDAGEDDLDLDLPPVGALRKRRDTFVGDEEDQQMGEPAGFSISRSRSLRGTNSVTAANDQAIVRKRTLESYATYVQEESQLTRRVGGGAAGVSVIRPQNTGLSRNGNLSSTRPAPVPHPHRQSTGGSHGSASGSGSVLLSKGNKFA